MDLLDLSTGITAGEYDRMTRKMDHPLTWQRQWRGFSSETFRKNETDDRRES